MAINPEKGDFKGSSWGITVDNTNLPMINCGTEKKEPVSMPCRFKVGDRVMGGYSNEKYTGTIISIHPTISTVWVKRDDYGSWRCLIRPDGSVAGAHGMDDGKTNLELFNDSNIIQSNVCSVGTISKDWFLSNPIIIRSMGDTESVGHIKNKKTSMIKKLSNFIKKMVDADTQALIEADYMFSDLGGLTNEGKEELMNILFIANKAALVEAAKAKIEEAKSKKD